MPIAQELPINNNASAIQMAQEIFGAGVTVVNADYSGDRRSSGTYSNGDAIADGVTPGDTGVILSTGRTSNFTRSSGSTNTNISNSTSSNTRGINDNADFNAAAGTRTYDAAFLDVDFIPNGDTMTIQFVFASEEYPEFVNSLYQDFIGVWVNGQQVDLAVGDGDIDPLNINGNSNESLFISNLNDDFNTEMDGFTATMTLNMNVIPGQVNSLRIGIADVSDSSYDSTLLIAGDSIQTAFIAGDDDVDIAPGFSRTVDVLANDGDGASTLTLTHINGQAVSTGSVVTLSTGQQLQVNADGTLTILADGDLESVTFSYTAETNAGISDTAFVTVNQVPCFVEGTRVKTPAGEVAVEHLEVGHLVLTKDDGAQPVRWIGSRTVAAEGDFAPIHIRRGTFGEHGDLWVSPLHRVMLSDPRSELLFGEAEVLVAAKELVDGRNVRQVAGGDVTYVHLMFDRHQILWSEGLETESFLPGPQMASAMEQDIMQEICALFPELDPATGEGYGPTARKTLRRFEATLLHPDAEDQVA
ncbi:Hint domain-containing protein [Thalassobius sp. Cn5-15]|uniref:Hint domain-containing protein n=1 Tax=Thalassobius sp. Cn5-15 TaxID=2917763 RepID=UPI001EF2842E|nr:Hint domain-containing protein [Thalassobius sp. Cn5-15]MCG7494130.1 Hint domain-containing protein [Thalassobius sp. Cn5-15]